MILITGGTGFVGNEVVRLLIKKKKRVRLLVRDAKKARKLFPRADIIQGELTDKRIIREALKGVGKVMHLAGMVSYKASWNDLYNTNVLLTKNLLDEAKKAKVKKFIFSSSVGVYGHQEGLVTEKSPVKHTTLYGKSKYQAEQLLAKSGLPYVAFRIAPVFGAGSTAWIKAIRMFDKGFGIPQTDNKTHMIHVSDVAGAFYLALNKGRGVYNIAGKSQVSVMSLCSKIIKNLGKPYKTVPFWLAKILVAFAGASGDFNAFVQQRHYDYSNAKKELGYKPKAVFDKEVERMVEWYLNLKER